MEKGIEKLTVVANTENNWEYRCGRCGQLRFYASKTPPTTCGACASTDLIIGWPGTLPIAQGNQKGDKDA